MRRFLPLLLLCGVAFGQGVTLTPKVTVTPKVTISPGAAGGGGNTPAFVQSNGGPGVSTLAYTSNVTSGNIGCAFMYDGGGTSLTLTITASLGETWTTLKSTNLATDGDTIAVACGGPFTSTAADTLTFKQGGTATAMNVEIYEFSGTLTTQDATAVSENTNGTTSCGATGPLSITTVTNNDLLFEGCGTSHGSETFTLTNSWLHLQGDTSGSVGATASMMKVGTTAGAFTAGGTFNSSGEEATIIIALKHS